MVQGPEGEKPRISRQEFYPKVGDPAETLKTVTPPFNQELLQVLLGIVRKSQLGVTLTYRHTGENPQELVVALRPSEQPGDIISVEISGDWEAKAEMQGIPIIANYGGKEEWDKGKFYRREKPDAERSLAQDGDILEPTKPMVIGMASAIKGQYWAYELDPADFPGGARISRFLAPDNKEGLDVTAGETIICYVVPL